MKTYALLLSILSFTTITIYAQRVQYSRQAADINQPDALQLVANISNHHHLVSFEVKRNPAIFIYDQQLQLIAKREVEFSIPQDCDIKIIPFMSYYFLYIYIAKTNAHRLWKIDARGNISAFSDVFLQLIQSNFKNRKNFKLTCVENKLYIVSSAYFKDLGKINTTIVQTDSMLAPVFTRDIFFKFGDGQSLRQHTLVTSDVLLVLKTAVTAENKVMEVLKIDIHNGSIIIKTFESKGSAYYSPGFFYNSYDSSILVFARLGNSLAARGRSISFISSLNNSLIEKGTDMLMTRLSNTGTNFILINDQLPWLAFVNYKFHRSFPRNRDRHIPDAEDILSDVDMPGRNLYQIPYKNAGSPASIHLTLFNYRQRTRRDSLIRNDDPKHYIDADNYGRVNLKNRSYLLLAKRNRKRNGLMLVFANERNELSTSDVHVYDKSDYIASQLQRISSNSVILPYIKRREAGLLKIDID